MTKSPIDRDAIEDEIIDLDVPMIGTDAVLMMLGDALGIPPLALIDAEDLSTHPDPKIRSSSALDDLRTAHGEQGVNLMRDALYEGIDSSTEVPAVRRSIELHLLLNALDN